MKVLIQMKYNSALDKKVRYLRKVVPQVEIYTDCERSPLDEIQVLIGGRITKEFVEQFKSLELIMILQTGINELPLEYLHSHSIVLVNSHSNSVYVAERALGLLLDLTGRISAYHMDLYQEHWHGFWVGGGMKDAWTSISGKTCGILGTGSIGTGVARMLAPFGCRVIGYRRTEGACPEGFDNVTRDLEKILYDSDIIIVALPLTDKTFGLLGADELAMLEGKYLVNVSRGKIVSESALYQALSDNILTGAAIDTWYTYPNGRNTGAPSKYPIHKLKNVVLSPHVGGFCREALIRVVDDMFINLESYIKTGEISNKVNLKEGY